MTETPKEAPISSPSTKSDPPKSDSSSLEFLKLNVLTTDTDCVNAMDYYNKEAALILQQNKLLQERVEKLNILRRKFESYEKEHKLLVSRQGYKLKSVETQKKLAKFMNKGYILDNEGKVILLVGFVTIIALCMFLGHLFTKNHYSNKLNDQLSLFDRFNTATFDIIKELRSNVTNLEETQKYMIDLKPGWKVMTNKDGKDALIVVINIWVILCLLCSFAGFSIFVISVVNLLYQLQGQQQQKQMRDSLYENLKKK